MTISEYAQYVVKNMGRASLANAMNITSKLGKGHEFGLSDFCDNIIQVTENLVSDKKIDKSKAYRILNSACTCKDRLNFKVATYSEPMLADRLIIDIWECFNGY